MIGNSDNEFIRGVCEPIVLKAGMVSFRDFQHRDFPVDMLIERPLAPFSSESIRGQAMESICVARCMESFWKDDFYRPYFPDLVRNMQAPKGVHDCRTGVHDHQSKLVGSFLNPEASHVVLPLAVLGGADVVYMHLSFHIKTVWTSSSSKTLIVSANKSLANLESIRKTLAVSPILNGGLRRSPGFRFGSRYLLARN